MPRFTLALTGGRTPATGLLLLLLPSALAGCQELEEEGEKWEAAASSAVPVHTATLERTSFTDKVKVYGRLAPKKQVRIHVESPGRIEGLPFEEGHRVGRGQVLARINARVMAAQVKQAEATFQLQKVETARLERMLEKKLTTPQQVEIARAQLAQAEASLELARANLDKAVVRSPIEGLVTNVSAERGEVANMGAPLLEVVDVQKLDVEADVPERDVALLRTGTEVEVVVEAFPGETFVGEVHEIGLTANAATRTFPIKVRLDNAEGRLRPGMLASLELERRRYDDVLVVPRDAVIDQIEGKIVYVAERGHARARPVVLGPIRGRFAVLKSGLAVGDRLVVLGHRQVVDGQAVEVTEEPPCCKAQLSGPAPAREAAAPTTAGKAPAQDPAESPAGGG